MKGSKIVSELIMEMKEKVIFDFNDESQLENWYNINDEVMGGKSTGNIKFIKSGLACFSGNISLLNNGGFSAVRAHQLPKKIKDSYSAVTFKVLGDGKTYSFRIKTSTGMDGINYKADFETINEQWQTITLYFKDFIPVYRGKKVEDAPLLDSQDIKQVGLLIANKQMGAFSIFVDWIKFLNFPVVN
ncbi:MAG: CIA30 family protein [Bacteroidota bacterium]